jgi:hypothetical protein
MSQKSSVPQAVSFVSQALKRDTTAGKLAEARLRGLARSRRSAPAS